MLVGGSLAAVIVGVGRFLDGQVVPGVNVHVVGPLVHVVKQILFRLGRTVQDAVDERHGLGAGDVAVGTEGVVGIALDPAVVVGLGDLADGSVTGDVCKAGLAVAGGLIEAGGDGGKLGAGDGLVRAEGSVGIALDDAKRGHGGDGVIEPGAAGNVAEVVGLREVPVADVVLEQAEEDSGDLGTGDLAARLDGAIGIADDVGEVVVRIQLVRAVDLDVVALLAGVDGVVEGDGLSDGDIAVLVSLAAQLAIVPLAVFDFVKNELIRFFFDIYSEL